MLYIESPAHDDFVNWNRALFLAGSITGAENWQLKAAQKLSLYYNIFNPRRKDFDVLNPEIEREQITWEHKYLNLCKNIIFYFSNETLAPITLFEYGTLINSDKNLFIGIHLDYKRKNDVLIQTELRAPSLLNNIVFDLDQLVEMTINYREK